MSRRPLLLGLTGSIGMGKSTVSGIIRKLGVPVFDADAAVHRLQTAGGRLVPAIIAMFPEAASQAGLDRAALAYRVLSDRRALKALEALVHPAVAQERNSFVRRHGAHRLIVLDIPLLFETGGERFLDAVALVSAPAAKQRRRVLERAGMTPQKLASVLRRQMPDRVKRLRADFLIPTGGSLRQTEAVVRRLIACLSSHPVRYCRQCERSFSIPKRPV